MIGHLGTIEQGMPTFRTAQAILVIAAVVLAWHWLGWPSFAIGLVVFMFYELLIPPPRYRRFGLGQAQQAADNKMGIFGKTYPDESPGPISQTRVGRNDACPCGSGRKFKRCCGRPAE